MPTFYPNTKYTLLDRSKRTAGGKKVLEIIRVMNELVDDFFLDVPFVNANMGLQHKIVRDTGMAASENRSFYQGVGASKQNVQVVYEKVQLKERRREIDEDEVDTLGDDGRAMTLRQEDEAHGRKLGEDVVNAYFNSTSDDGSEHMDGLFKRMDALNPSGLNNVRSNGHTGGGATTTSLLIIEWNTDKTGGAHGIIPSGFIQGQNMGVVIRDKGREKILDADDRSKAFYGYVAQHKAWMGLSVGNNRKIARLANINPVIDGSNNFNDGGAELLIQLLNDGRFDRNRTRIYVNTTLQSQMDILAMNKSNMFWQPMEVFGRKVTSFQGQIPIRALDTTIITNTQAVVTT